MIFRLHHKTVTVSTNLDAREGVPGDVFTAEEQTAGRGRLDHRWLSPAGVNVTLSAVLDVTDLSPERVVTLPLAVGLAVRDAVARFLPDGEIRLKWPNDVLVSGRKIAGILCERNGDRVIAGVGVNVNQTVFAPEIAPRATSLACEGASVPVAAVRDAFLAELAAVWTVWRTGGFAALLPRYVAVDFLKGKTVSVFQTDEDETPLTGRCEGVQADGTLLVAGRAVYAGEAHVRDWTDGAERM